MTDYSQTDWLQTDYSHACKSYERREATDLNYTKHSVNYSSQVM